MTNSDHEFGGVSTDLKLSVVESYLQTFTKALRSHFRQLWYIDAFAGTGERTIRLGAQDADLFDPESEERIERRRGSAQIAIDTDPPFNRIIFMDNNRRHCEALKRLKEVNLDREIEIIEEDANIAIIELIRKNKWSDKRAVMFLDPYGMNVNWETLKLIQQTKAIDVWYLVSLAGLFRQAARKQSGIDDTKRAALNRMLGTSAWEAAWYSEPEPDLFGEKQDGTRVADIAAMEEFVQKRLAELFPKVLKPLRLKNDRGVPMFSLFFAISNPEPQAVGLAQKIANHILNSGRSSQVLPK
jgi:three-Cys-motif partner protein